MLVRVTRGCGWNRCKFCGIYPALGEPGFTIRPFPEVLRDIEWFAARGLSSDTVFLGDADPLSIPLDDAVKIIRAVRERMPHIKRITAYGRASTVRKLGAGGVSALARAGLNRLHLGLESGDRRVLAFHRKGQTPGTVVEAGRLLKSAAIEVSLYILLGLGGAERWREHIDGTAAVINRVDPEFLRVRRLWVCGGSGPTEGESPLWPDIRAGAFAPQTPEGTVRELRRLVERLDQVTGHLLCDHANNFVQVSGRMPAEREAMLAELDDFLSLPRQAREEHYARVGSRI
jgi:hypothetical protein